MRRIQSDFAILDVKHGRRTLKNGLDHGETVEVIIRGCITGVHGRDDGESREFIVRVDSVKEIE